MKKQIALALVALASTAAHATNSQCPVLAGTYLCPNGNFTMGVKTQMAGDGTAVYTYQYSYMPLPYVVVASDEGTPGRTGDQVVCEGKTSFYFRAKDGSKEAWNFINEQGNYQVLQSNGYKLICTKI